eukprot:CAMPEP_0116889356 /NCGR_PEP_ID=MMETSP0463-20121206/24776_1 /TAXON_ID=181622 /ORGANISM="Strombidinopsis sp, Strain SopsisLIS2011" /LENGTH=36 /DNA_ID= /DNA_START= /DNA_END= /DNA_ORIENTATION=
MIMVMILNILMLCKIDYLEQHLANRHHDLCAWIMNT